MIFTQEQWEDEFALIPLVADQTWKPNWAQYLFDTTAKYSAELGLELAGWVGAGSFDFQFNNATFQSSLVDSLPNNGLTNLSTAFDAAINATVLTVIPPFTAPAIDVVTTVLVDEPSIAAGQAIILATDNSQTTLDPKQAAIITTLRNAFLALTYTVSGTSGGGPVTYPTQGVN